MYNLQGTWISQWLKDKEKVLFVIGLTILLTIDLANNIHLMDFFEGNIYFYGMWK